MQEETRPILIKGGIVANSDRSSFPFFFLGNCFLNFHLQYQRQFRADVYCENGKIVNIGLNLTTPNNVEVIDATDKYVNH